MEKNKSTIQEEALGIVLNYKRSTAVAGTGVGKTLLGLKHMSLKYSAGLKFTVVASKTTIFKEWKEQASMHGYGYLIPHITFVTYLSLSKNPLDCDVLYLDEVHNLLYTHKPVLAAYEGEILGLTGTPPLTDYSEKAKMIQMFCPIVFTYGVDDGVGDGILNDYQIFVHMLDLDVNKNIAVPTKNGTIFYTSERASYDYWCQRIDAAATPKQKQIARIMRMKIMQSFLSKEVLAKKLLNMTPNKCIVFANTKEQADRLCADSFYSGNPKSDENLKKFKEGTIMKLAAIHQLSEGINIPNLAEGIILHSFGGNSPKAKQKFGRLLRLSPELKSTLRILCYRGTADEMWVQENLDTLDNSKIFYI